GIEFERICEHVLTGLPLGTHLNGCSPPRRWCGPLDLSASASIYGRFFACLRPASGRRQPSDLPKIRALCATRRQKQTYVPLNPSLLRCLGGCFRSICWTRRRGASPGRPVREF